MTDWDEIGKGAHPAQNPPPIDEGDRFVWNWYFANCTKFAQDFNLLPELIKGLGMDRKSLELFLRKLSLIHLTIQKIQQEEMESEMRKIK